MRYVSVLLVALNCFISLSCNKSAVTDSPPDTLPPPKFMLLRNYSVYIDSLYYKAWSDSTWERFARFTTLNGISYSVTITDAGNEYYYGPLGYSGFKPKGQSLIIFDAPMPSLPDTVLFNITYTRQTTFYFQGYNYTMKAEQMLQDTVSVSVPFGIFRPCLWFSGKTTLSAGGQSDMQSTQSWLAIGPGDIKETLNSGVTIIMVRGRVNGRGWGMSLNKGEGQDSAERASHFATDIMRPLTRF